MAGESLNRPDESKLSSVRFLLFPLVWLRQLCVQLRCPLPRGRCLGADMMRNGGRKLAETEKHLTKLTKRGTMKAFSRTEPEHRLCGRTGRAQAQ